MRSRRSRIKSRKLTEHTTRIETEKSEHQAKMIEQGTRVYEQQVLLEKLTRDARDVKTGWKTIDPKTFQKPSKFDGQQDEEFSDWREEMLNVSRTFWG